MSNETLTVAMPDADVLNNSAQRALDNANSMVIDSPVLYQAAAEDLQAVKRKFKELDETRSSIVKPLNDTVKRINDLFRAPMQYLQDAESVLKRRMLTYTEAQERARKAEEARLRAEAEARAAEERRRLEEERAAAEERARREREALEAERQVALDAGDTVKAAKLEVRAESVEEKRDIKSDSLEEQVALVAAAPVISMPAAPAAKGISTRSNWRAELTDKNALIAAAVNNPMFAALLVVDEKAANGMAKSLKENFNVPGLKAVEEKVMSSRAA